MAMATPTMAATAGSDITTTAAGPSAGGGAAGRVRQRLQQEFGKQMSERTLQDLLKLASYRMLGAAAGGQQKHFTRSTTLVLAQRPRRAAALRCVGASCLPYACVVVGGNVCPCTAHGNACAATAHDVRTTSHNP